MMLMAVLYVVHYATRDKSVAVLFFASGNTSSFQTFPSDTVGEFLHKPMYCLLQIPNKNN